MTIIIIIAAVLIIGAIAIAVTNQQTNETKEEQKRKLGKDFSKIYEYRDCQVYYNKTAKKVAVLKCFSKDVSKKVFDNFEYSYSHSCGNSCLLFDETNRNIIAIETVSHTVGVSFTVHQFSYESILSVQLIEDEETIFSKSAARTVGGTLVGGALIGEAGAIVGGLSGSTKQKKKVNNVTLKIVIKNASNPTILLSVYNKSTDIGSNLDSHKANANKTIDALNVIIDMIDKEFEASIKTSEPIAQPTNSSISDELLKLADLMNKGILTEEEFLQQKQKLLNR